MVVHVPLQHSGPKTLVTEFLSGVRAAAGAPLFPLVDQPAADLVAEAQQLHDLRVSDVQAAPLGAGLRGGGGGEVGHGVPSDFFCVTSRTDTLAFRRRA